MLFLSAQPLQPYFLWQVQICISNLNQLGISKASIHVLFASDDSMQINDKEKEVLNYIKENACVFFYEDDRVNTQYLSSVRPHILAKHFSAFPQLKNEQIFYHDCDIIFRQLPPIFSEQTSTWYVSDTANYLDSKYIKSQIGEYGFIEMCRLVGIPPQQVIAQDENCGGAQYLVRNVTAAFWQKVEQDCEAIYTFLENVNTEKKIRESVLDNKINLHGIQSWCADMWAVLWNALYFGFTVETHKELDFCWPTNDIEEWNNNYILHNAGITLKQADEYFFKGNYQYQFPYWDNFNFINSDSCSYQYTSEITKGKEIFNRIPLSQITFLIPVMIDSQDRLDNVLTNAKYLSKHFTTNIAILETGENEPLVDNKILPPGVQYSFSQSSNKLMHHTAINNQLIKSATTPFIAILDTDIIFPVQQLAQAYDLLLKNEAEMVYPYDGSFISMDKLSSVIFSKFLAIEFLAENMEKFVVASRRSFGGCVFLNRAAYLKAGGENLAFTSWGPEDIERYHRMKILGYRVKRVDGPLYHMHHERGINSGYAGTDRYVAFMEEYINVFNMKKQQLEAYVCNW